jgi:hypothetical protein
MIRWLARLAAVIAALLVGMGTTITSAANLTYDAAIDERVDAHDIMAAVAVSPRSAACGRSLCRHPMISEARLRHRLTLLLPQKRWGTFRPLAVGQRPLPEGQMGRTAEGTGPGPAIPVSRSFRLAGPTIRSSTTSRMSQPTLRRLSRRRAGQTSSQALEAESISK